MVHVKSQKLILLCKTHFSRQLNCCSLRCSWSISCRRCSNYIFILHLTLGLNMLGKDNCKPRRETFRFWDLVRVILEILRYYWYNHNKANHNKTVFTFHGTYCVLGVWWIVLLKCWNLNFHVKFGVKMVSLESYRYMVEIATHCIWVTFKQL